MYIHDARGPADSGLSAREMMAIKINADKALKRGKRFGVPALDSAIDRARDRLGRSRAPQHQQRRNYDQSIAVPPLPAAQPQAFTTGSTAYAAKFKVTPPPIGRPYAAPQVVPIQDSPSEAQQRQEWLESLRYRDYSGPALCEPVGTAAAYIRGPREVVAVVDESILSYQEKSLCKFSNGSIRPIHWSRLIPKVF